jgi:transposase
MNITTIGLDLAKNVFQIHGLDGQHKAVFRKTLKRAQMLPFFANLPPCLVGMEACGSAHYWARKLERLGHTVKLMAPRRIGGVAARDHARRDGRHKDQRSRSARS